MAVLLTQLRNRLEAAVKQARRTAETAAKVALERLTVGSAEPGTHLSSDERQLRNRLRAHGRQLGDQRDPRTGTQSINRLIHECAYEHWHRMLFARFLAENHLLIHDKEGIPVTLAECDELAKEESADYADERRFQKDEENNLRKSAQSADQKSVDGWTLAARYAARMLPQVFRPDDPVLQVGFAPEHKRALEKLVTELPAEVFTASDSLGWVYQFWQAERKEQVNKAGNKIGADELPAVTQLFTEDYMVDFLLDNTLGAWWAGKALAANPKLAEDAKGEEELRQAVALPGVPWKYLRFIKGKDGKWTPAAGTFDGWPRTAKELKCLDPCMGSGHFVVAMFERLVAMRMAEEKLDKAAAVAAVIRDNLFGLEIDPRCTQIAAFNPALAAWRRVGHCKLPPMNLACSGLAPNAKREDWLKLAERAAQSSALAPERDLLGTEQNLLSQRLRFAMGALYDLFQKAPVLGSLIDPRRDKAVTYATTMHELQPLLEEAMRREKADEVHELAVTARGLAKAAEMLAGQFTLVATNVPYLGRGKQDEVLMDFCERVHPEAKADLATCFVERSLTFCGAGGSIAFVTPQKWVSQNYYTAIRSSLLEGEEFNVLVRMGTNAFQTPMWDFNTTLVQISKRRASNAHLFSGYDLTSFPDAAAKSGALAECPNLPTNQHDQLGNPDAVIVLGETATGTRIGELADCIQGMLPADRGRLVRYFWERSHISDGWEFMQGSDDSTSLANGRYQIFAFDFFKEHYEGIGGRYQGTKALGKAGISVSKMSVLPVTLYSGKPFDGNAHALVPHRQADLAALWAFCSSAEFSVAVRKVDPKLDVTNASIEKVPFDLAHWQKVAAEKYPHGLPKPYTDDPTQWLFDGHPARNPEDFARLKDDPATRPLLQEPDGSLSPVPSARRPFALQVAVARLLGYRWPRQTGSSFLDCPALGPDGLEQFADVDGIVCIPSVRGEAPAAERLRALLAAAYLPAEASAQAGGQAWSPARQDELLAQASGASDSGHGSRMTH
jgi:hypothetical protein